MIEPWDWITMATTREIIAICFGFLFMMTFGPDMHMLSEKYRMWFRKRKPPTWMTSEMLNGFALFLIMQLFLVLALTFLYLSYRYR